MNCPECLNEMRDGAAVCGSCGVRVRGRQCPECAEFAREAAQKCPHCHHDFDRERRVATFEDFATKAHVLPTMLFRGRFIPQEIHLNRDRILIRTFGLFWLSCLDDEIPWEKVAGYHYHSGLFWDGVEIQTRGQKATSIIGLEKSDGRRVKDILEQMKQ